MARQFRPPLNKKKAGLAADGPTAPAEGEVISPAFVAEAPPRIGYIDKRLYFTVDQRKVVRDMASWGVPFESICQHIPNPDTGRPINHKTLAFNFRDELDSGMAEANAKIAKSAYIQAVGWPAEFDEGGNLIRAEQEPVPMMTKWLTQSRLGFKDTVVVEGGGGFGGQMSLEDMGKQMANLQYDDLLKLREITKRQLEAPTEGG